jgi:raffinose/stachyose/melibiose transport system substrate-binding protein
MKHLVLLVIIALSIWALLPPPNETRIGEGQPASTQPSASNRAVRYHLTMDPGPLYIPGVVPENAAKPVNGMRVVADEFERLFPDTHIDFVAVPSGTREWLVTKVSSAQAPDVIQVNARDAWQDVRKNWYVPLDGYLDAPNPFVKPGEPGSARWWDQFKYPVHTQSTRAPDGKIYNVSLDMIETGIYYNKTLFGKHGLKPPRDWAEFIDINRTLKAAGVRSPMLAERRDFTDWSVDIVFDQMYGAMRPLLDLNYDPRRGEDLNGYLDWDEVTFLHRKGFFTPTDARWREVFRILRDLRTYMPDDLTGTDVHKAFVTEQGAMLWGSALSLPRLRNDPQLGFEWGLFYLPPITPSTSRFGDGHRVAAIGGSAMQYHVTNSAVADTPADMPFDQRVAKSERLKRVIAFLQYLCMPHATDTVVNEIIAFVPNIKGVDGHPALQPFDEFLTRHYAMTKWFFTYDLQFDEVLERMFELYMNDGITEDEFLTWMDRATTSAADTMVGRHHPDFAPLDRAWQEHARMRAQFPELPEGAMR